MFSAAILSASGQFVYLERQIILQIFFFFFTASSKLLTRIRSSFFCGPQIERGLFN